MILDILISQRKVTVAGESIPMDIGSSQCEPREARVAVRRIQSESNVGVEAAEGEITFTFPWESGGLEEQESEEGYRSAVGIHQHRERSEEGKVVRTVTTRAGSRTKLAPSPPEDSQVGKEAVKEAARGHSLCHQRQELVETVSPNLPVNRDVRINTPAFIGDVACKLAVFLRLPVTDVLIVTERNGRRLYGARR